MTILTNPDGTNKYAYIEWFPPVVLELQKEVALHPKLVEQLTMNRLDSDLETRVGTIAAYCDILLDGYYDESQLMDLFPILVEKLRKKRGPEVIVAVPTAVITGDSNAI